MFRNKRLFMLRNAKVLTLLALAMLPLLTGCIVELTAATFGTVLWLDLALTPVRSALGNAALDFVNSF